MPLTGWKSPWRWYRCEFRLTHLARVPLALRYPRVCSPLGGHIKKEGTSRVKQATFKTDVVASFSLSIHL